MNIQQLLIETSILLTVVGVFLQQRRIFGRLGELHTLLCQIELHQHEAQKEPGDVLMDRLGALQQMRFARMGSAPQSPKT